MRDLVNLQMNRGLSNGDVLWVVLRSTERDQVRLQQGRYSLYNGNLLSR